MVTFADTLQSACGRFVDKGNKGAITALFNSIEKSERFVFSKEATQACDELSCSKPTSLLEATKFCRIPFQKMWLEFDPSRDRPLKPEHWASEFEVDAPLKIGCLIECLDDTHQRFGVTLAWETPRSSDAMKSFGAVNGEDIGPLVNVCPIGFVVNWHDEWLLGDSSSILNGTHYLPSKIQFRGTRRKYEGIKEQEEAALELVRRRVPSFVPCCREFVNYVAGTNSFLNRERLQKLSQAAAQDWEGEYELIIAMLCLLNSKNCISVESADLKKINKKRKITRKPPLISYSTVTINLSKSDAKAATQLGVSEAEIRRHIVRGHFKIRKGGIFWWRPFLRGSSCAGEVRRAGYNVINTSDNLQAAV